MRAAAVALTAGAAALLAGSAHSTPATVIVFAADRAPAVSGDVFRVDANGRVANLTHSPWQETQPAVSPNGKLIAFLSDRAGGGLWLIGVDGRGLRRVPSVDVPSQDDANFAWAPDSRTIALAVGTVNHATLSLAGVGVPPRTIAHGPAFGPPSWSPDGALVTVRSFGDVRAYTAGGALEWTVPAGLAPVGWSATGLFASGEWDGALRVYDRTGKQLFRVRGAQAAWSPDGGELAVVNGRRGSVYTSAGRLLSVQPVADVYADAPTWTSARRVVFGTPRAFGPNTVKTGSTFAVRVGSHVYTHVPGCDDDGGPYAAIAQLQLVPHSTSIVYQSDCAEPFDNLYAINPDGTGLRRITNVQANQVEPIVSPDGTRIVFGQRPLTGLSCKGCPESVRTIGIDGSDPTTLTSPPDCAFDDWPNWSPDGTQIMFSHSECDSAPVAMVLPAAGGTPTSLGVPAWTLAWGPSRIAYADGSTAPSTVWTAAPDGTDRREVAGIGGGLTTPAWSADGRLAYLVGTTAVVQGRKVQLPFAQVRSIAWSPDGERFLVAAQPKGAPTFDLYTVKTDGTDAVRLTSDMDVSSGDWR